MFIQRFGALCVATTLAIAMSTKSQAQVTAALPDVACKFDSARLQFEGAPLEQAKCLLRPVFKYGHIGSPLPQLPAPLETLVGTAAMQVTKDRVRAFVTSEGVNPSELGGDLNTALSRAHSNDPNAPLARYFVIHDTSSCVQSGPPSGGCGPATVFPQDADKSTRRWNQPETWRNFKDAHLFITRDGQLIAPQGRTFSVPWRATKREAMIGEPSRGLFLHIENVQPRLSDSNAARPNDATAPVPGFTEIQLRRLAMVYVSASLRAGTWLIPAYHAALDAGLGDGHDDPQNFDLTAWAGQICAVIKGAGGSCQ